ncbi:MAG: nucleotidyl transferase AbiEii/AbiGii toxin family protein [Candidatus Diapherotrites archaeon]|uniref:Nucleotidyl transferase AbiEii/AbiGii toxin family protein n=1 Tax=Candidatus Iainarchaeum sp. TaxID=3101447 RepID=A0A8T4LC44_9ARCH|nr:nucleotidyl transferase AbiEii/AbiGii toxin family protein [Candidatus Diapherotrites archaeon]
MRLPLFNRLRRQLHRDIAFVQDQVLEIVYALEGKAVLHGGTALWRCYQGNRFSEDLDFYFVPKKGFREAFAREISSAGLKLAKYKQTANSVYAKVEREGINVAFEAALREFREPVVREYEKLDGSSLDVFTLSAEDLLLEKLAAFRGRRLVRDIYDVYHLSRLAGNEKGFKEKVAGQLVSLPQPVDEKNLNALVLSGAVPSFAQMADALRRRFSK